VRKLVLTQALKRVCKNSDYPPRKGRPDLSKLGSKSACPKADFLANACEVAFSVCPQAAPRRVKLPKIPFQGNCASSGGKPRVREADFVHVESHPPKISKHWRVHRTNLARSAQTGFDEHIGTLPCYRHSSTAERIGGYEPTYRNLSDFADRVCPVVLNDMTNAIRHG
jgi:hypothetical protein